MRPINLDEPIATKASWYQVNEWPIFMLAFRPFFLGAAIWAVISIALWSGILMGKIAWSTAIPATLWHAHEMIFGFSGAVAVGFLLTAAQTWTNVPSINSWKLCSLVAVWGVTRCVFFIHADMLWAAFIGQITFWFCAIVFLSNMLLKAQSKNNYIFIFILCALSVFNTLFFILLWQEDFSTARTFSHLAVLMFMLLIGVVGGRVIPFFTARGLGLQAQIRTPHIDKLLLWVSLLGISGFILSQVFSLPLNPGYLIACAAFLHLIRAALWFDPCVVKVPLLWSLQLGYTLSAIGLLLVAGSFFSTLMRLSDALHLITLDGMGLVIISMISRVSLGHTGRPLRVHPSMSIAFIAVTLGALCRAFLPSVINPHLAWLLSAALWCLGFSLFVYHYFPVLTQQRVDGRRG